MIRRPKLRCSLVRTTFSIPPCKANMMLFCVVALASLLWGAVVQGMAIELEVDDNSPSAKEVANAIAKSVERLEQERDPNNPIAGPSLKEVADAIQEVAQSGKTVKTCGGTASSDVRDCVFPFIYKGVEYHGCTTADFHQPWCATVGGAYELHKKWGICECEDGKPLPVKTCGGTATPPNALCHFPFTFSGTTYHGCTTADHDRPWCSTGGGKWGNCNCGEVADRGKMQTCGGSANGAACAFPFMYGGKKYTSCTTDAHNQPWCSTTPQYAGKWGNCRCAAQVKTGTNTPTCGGSAGDGVANRCFFPFHFDGNLHYDCIVTDDRPQLWCGTNAGSVEIHGNWGFCGSC